MQYRKSDPAIQSQTMMGHQLTQFHQANCATDPQEGGKRFGDSRMEIIRRENCEGNIAMIINKSNRFENLLRFSSSEALKTTEAYPTSVALGLSFKLREQERAYDGDQRHGLSPFEYLHEFTLSSRASEPLYLHIDWDSIRAKEAALQEHKFDDDNDSLSSIDSIDSIQLAKIRQLRRRNKIARDEARKPTSD
jgi:hypothetical protein